MRRPRAPPARPACPRFFAPLPNRRGRLTCAHPPHHTRTLNVRRSLSNYNQELVACIEDLREKREELNRSLLRDEEEKAKIQKELTVLTERLSRLNEDLARKMQVRWRARRGRLFFAARRAPPSPPPLPPSFPAQRSPLPLPQPPTLAGAPGV